MRGRPLGMLTVTQRAFRASEWPKVVLDIDHVTVNIAAEAPAPRMTHEEEEEWCQLQDPTWRR